MKDLDLRGKLVIKMMKYGLPRLGAMKVVNELDDDQVSAASINSEYLQSVIDVMYYKKTS